MKHSRTIISALALVAVLGFTSCNQRAKDLEAANLQMKTEQNTRDSLLNEFMTAYDAIETNLDEIAQREELIFTDNTDDFELQKDRKTSVIDQITAINSLLDENKQIMADLERRAEEADAGLGEYRRSIRRLQLKVKEREEMIASLKTELEEADYQVAELNRRADTLQFVQTNLVAQQENHTARLMAQTEVLGTQDLTITTQTTALNKAYVVMGTAKELREKEIIDKQGGFLGIGAKHKFNPSATEQSFLSIDVTEIQEFPLDVKKAKIVTNHPEGTYAFTETDGRVAELKITDPTSFWETSKFLVVVLN